MNKALKIGCGCLMAPFALLLFVILLPITLPLAWFGMKIAVGILIVYAALHVFKGLCHWIARG